MNCEEATKLMDGYLDGELDPLSNQKIEQHLQDCPECDRAYEAHRALIHTIGSATPYYKAPVELRERIQSSLREEIAERPLRNVARGSFGDLLSQGGLNSLTEFNWCLVIRGGAANRG